MEGEWKESKIERLDEGIWARRACSHLHTLPALRLSQSPTEEAPVSLPQSSPSTPLSLSLFLSSLHHCSFSALDPQESPREQVFSVKQPAERGETQRQRELTRRPNRARAWEGEGEGLALGPPPAGVTLHPAWPRCLIPSLLIYHVWTYSCSSGFRLKTNCWSGGFVKEMSVLSAEGLKLI